MGEFEKKIHGMFDTETLKSNNEVQGIFLEFCNSAKRGLLELVEEAKKEFPHLIPQIPMGMERVNDYINKELNPWVEKWFGGSE